MVNLANYLSTQGYVITIVMVADNRYLENALLPEVTVVSFKKKRICASLTPLIRYMHSHKIDTFIVNIWPFTIIALAAGFTLPGFHRKTILVEHCHLERELAEPHRAAFKFFQKRSIAFFTLKALK
jgi:hypothetical protein